MASDSISFHSRDAIARVREEIAFIRDELEAFERFKQRVECVPCVSSARSGTVVSDGAVAAESTAMASSVTRLKQAYQSTVMSVPHYESEYGDTYEESVQTEFNEPVSHVLLGSVYFTPLAKSRLVSAIENAKNNRSALLDELDRERDELSMALNRFEEWEKEIRQIHDRIARWNDCRASEELARLERIGRECDRHSAERQQRLRQQPGSMYAALGPDGFAQYLYEDTPFTMPILADISSIGSRLDAEREHIQQQLAPGST